MRREFHRRIDLDDLLAPGASGPLLARDLGRRTLYDSAELSESSGDLMGGTTPQANRETFCGPFRRAKPGAFVSQS